MVGAGWLGVGVAVSIGISVGADCGVAATMIAVGIAVGRSTVIGVGTSVGGSDTMAVDVLLLVAVGGNVATSGAPNWSVVFADVGFVVAVGTTGSAGMLVLMALAPLTEFIVILSAGAVKRMVGVM